MTRVPFAAVVAIVTGLAGAVTVWAVPGRMDLAGGITLGTGGAGLFAAMAVAVLGRVKAKAATRPDSGADATTNLARAFAGLMLARMIGYLALVLLAVATGLVDTMAVCLGLAVGTLVFQALEVMYLRNLK